MRNSPDELSVREVKVAHQGLVTTMLDHRQGSKDDLSALFGRRWNVELDLRNLKTTTGMDVLSCQTPQMNAAAYPENRVPAQWRPSARPGPTKDRAPWSPAGD